jgi:hypothetical protein
MTGAVPPLLLHFHGVCRDNFTFAINLTNTARKASHSSAAFGLLCRDIGDNE